ncbi:hypothetical protein [uncultured Polaribacter sp.]|uniref:hypothetical protein n=1 Tax=uncultured Polaribacter sp. TaxID=174711 RepID=UPI00261A32FB|nr:hypothetical protein [uncultured Polaribacter sp.]
MTFTSCEDSEDSLDVDAGIVAEGVITTLSGTSGKLLGNALNPADLETSEVALTDANAELTLNLSVLPGQIPSNVAKYQIVKSFEGGEEVVVIESETLPISTSFDSVSDYFEGLNVDLKNVRIGNQINFKVKVFTNSGNVFYQGSNFSKYDVTVNCASALAGVYSLRFTSNFNHDITFPNEIITEVSPGVYKTTTTYRWASPDGLPAPDQGFNFSDVCGTLNVPQQGLAQGFYSNQVYNFADGSVDSTTGDLKIYYIIEFSGGATKIECTGVYTKL